MITGVNLTWDPGLQTGMLTIGGSNYRMTIQHVASAKLNSLTADDWLYVANRISKIAEDRQLLKKDLTSFTIDEKGVSLPAKKIVHTASPSTVQPYKEIVDRLLNPSAPLPPKLLRPSVRGPFPKPESLTAKLPPKSAKSTPASPESTPASPSSIIATPSTTTSSPESTPKLPSAKPTILFEKIDSFITPTKSASKPVLSIDTTQSAKKAALDLKKIRQEVSGKITKLDHDLGSEKTVPLSDTEEVDDTEEVEDSKDAKLNRIRIKFDKIKESYAIYSKEVDILVEELEIERDEKDLDLIVLNAKYEENLGVLNDINQQLDQTTEKLEETMQDIKVYQQRLEAQQKEIETKDQEIAKLKKENAELQKIAPTVKPLAVKTSLAAPTKYAAGQSLNKENQLMN